MSLLRIPRAFESPTVEPEAGSELRQSNAQETVATRLPPTEVKAIKDAAKAQGQLPSEWIREALLLHLKRPAQKKKPAPDPTILAELMALRSLVQNLIAAASDLPEETVQRIVKHADVVKEAKAEEILKRFELAQGEGK